MLINEAIQKNFFDISSCVDDSQHEKGLLCNAIHYSPRCGDEFAILRYAVHFEMVRNSISLSSLPDEERVCCHVIQTVGSHDYPSSLTEKTECIYKVSLRIPRLPSTIASSICFASSTPTARTVSIKGMTIFAASGIALHPIFLESHLIFLGSAASTISTLRKVAATNPSMDSFCNGIFP